MIGLRDVGAVLESRVHVTDEKVALPRSEEAATLGPPVRANLSRRR